jgi:hypothetical protein
MSLLSWIWEGCLQRRKSQGTGNVIDIDKNKNNLPLATDIDIDSTAVTISETFAREIGTLRDEITTMRDALSTLLLRLGDDHSITAATSDSTISTDLLSSIIDTAAQSTERASVISTKAQVELVRVNHEWIEMRTKAARIPFAGGSGSHTVLSVLAGEHSIGGGILQYVNMRQANDLRLVCPEFLEAVTEFPWTDAETRIKGSVKAWRKIFPYARAVNVSGRNDIVDADFIHIRGEKCAKLHTVIMSMCKRVTNAAFVYLRGIHTLDMSYCGQITDAAFVRLKGIHTLYMSGCDQTITDAAFVHLRGIHTLHMNRCSQATITFAAFVHFRGIHTLNISSCNQSTITDAAFVHLRGIHTLYMSYCDQLTITNAAFVHLRGIHTLSMWNCRQATITDAAFDNLRGIHTLYIEGCYQITHDAIFPLNGIFVLDIAVNNYTLEKKLCSLWGIREWDYAPGSHYLSLFKAPHWRPPILL